MRGEPRPIPAEPSEWLHEIALAWKDARAAIPYGSAIGEPFGEEALFHLAPLVCVKMRGFPSNSAPISRAREAALASYVATTEQQPEVKGDHLLMFAFCYLGSHYGLDLLAEDDVDEIMSFVEQNRDDLVRRIDAA